MRVLRRVPERVLRRAPERAVARAQLDAARVRARGEPLDAAPVQARGAAQAGPVRGVPVQDAQALEPAVLGPRVAAGQQGWAAAPWPAEAVP